MNGNITTAPLGGNRNIKTKPLFQYDYGQVLKIVGVTLPAAYEVHFSNQLHGVATTQIGNADGVIIPDIYLTTGEPVYAWIYLHAGNSDGETEYTITIPVVRRASISDAEPTPVQQDVITQAIAALNTAVEQTAQDVQDATEAKQDAEEAAGDAYESAVAAAQSATNAGTYAGNAQTAQAASELAQQKAEEAQTGAQTAKWAAESAQIAAEAAQAGAVAARTGAETAQAWAVAARSGAEAAQHAAEAARDEITGLSATATTLPAGSQATASYSDGLLTIGVPNGEKGDTGDTGATPDLTIGTVQTLPAGSSATASITGTPEDPVLNLGIPKGDQGEVSQAEFDALADDVSDIQDTLEHKADIDGYYTDMTVGAAEQVVSSTMVEDNAPYKLRTSGGSTDIGNRAYVDKIVGGTVAWNQLVRDAASENVTEYADVVTVTDAVEDDAAVSVEIEPVQDLHGYDSPWPAGGGANKWDEEWVVSHEDIDTSTGEIISSPLTMQYFRSKNFIPVQGDTPYYNFNSAITGNYRFFYYDSNKNYISYESRPVNGANTPPATAAYMLFRFSVSSMDFVYQNNIAINFPYTVTTYSPYSNLCPISGWDEVNVTRAGKNLLPPAFTEGWSNTVGGITAEYSNGVLHLYGTNNTSGYVSPVEKTNFWFPNTIDYGAGTYIAPSQMVMRCSVDGGAYINYTQAITATKSIKIRGFYTAVAAGQTVDWYYPVMMVLGTERPTATDYEAYQGTQYTIEMPTSAGTVYGGELTVNKDGSGSLVVDSINYDVSNDTSWGIATTTFGRKYFYKQVTATATLPRYSAAELALAKTNEKYSCGRIENPYDHTENCAWAYRAVDGGYLRIGFSNEMGIDTIEKFNEWRANNTVQIYYPLLNSTTYTLTASQVQTLLGTNNVWSDAGQIALAYTGTDEHLVLTSGRKYLTRINGTDSMVLGAGQEVTAVKGRDNVFDLTQMLGTSVADYVYQQGAGYFRKWFGAKVYPYNAGELISVEGLQSRDVVGFNQWDEEWKVQAGRIESKNLIPVLPNTEYAWTAPTQPANGLRFYDFNKTLISTIYGTQNNKFTTPENCHYIWFALASSYGTTYNHDVCINLSNSGTRNGSYEPYTHRSYPLDSTLTLRGIPKVGTNGVYWDGDEYGYDGAVKRRYLLVDMGTLDWLWYSNVERFAARVPAGITGGTGTGRETAINLVYPLNNAGYRFMDDKTMLFGSNFFSAQTCGCVVRDDAFGGDVNSFKASLSGKYLLYEAAVETTETATPYQQIQSVDDWGTEEFVSGTITPVGHVTRYPANLRDKLQHLPALASSNGSYIITQTDGQMVLSPFPTPPTTAGNYLLKATVSGGNATYSWVAQ